MLAPFATPFFSATAGLHLSWEVPEPAATPLPRRVAPLCPLLLRSFFQYYKRVEDRVALVETALVCLQLL